VKNPFLSCTFAKKFMPSIFVKKQKFRSDKVTLSDWEKFHPDQIQVNPTNSYYLNLCNKILEIISNSTLKNSTASKDEMIELSCLLGAYFEDVISETGLFASFTKMHKKLYGKYLPFYDLDEEYYTDEINLSDIHFLIWHYFATIYYRYSEAMYNPLYSNNSAEKEAIAKIYELLNEEFEKAPQNEKLQAFLQLSDKGSVFEIRNILEFLSCRLYLNKTDYSFFIEDTIDEWNKNERDMDEKGVNMFMYDEMVAYIFNYYSSLLALRSNAVLAEMIGKQHACYHLIRNISEHTLGIFLFKERNEDADTFEHVTGVQIKVSRELSRFNEKYLVPDQSCYIMGVVQWGDIWQQMGAASTGHNYQQIIADKKKIESITLLDYMDEKKAILEKMKTAFLQVNQGKLIAYFKGIEDYTEFNESWLKAYTLATTPDIKNEELFALLENAKSQTPDFLRDNEDGIVLFFNPNIGIEIHPGFACLLADKDNSYFDPLKKYSLTDIILEKTLSPEFVLYMIDNNLIQSSFPEDDKAENTLILDNLDFLLKYYRKESYWSEPKITYQSFFRTV
jgi:hypothetical protein